MKLVAMNSSAIFLADSGLSQAEDATGKSVSRGLDVRSYGATGDGIADDTAAFIKTIESLPAGGGAVYVPSGTYLISAPISLPSNILVFGDGASSLLLASRHWVAPGQSEFEFFKNVNYTSTTVVDRNITIENLAFSYTNLRNVPNGGNHAIRFRKAGNIRISSCTFLYGNDATALLGCVDTVIFGCEALYQNNACYDHWEGPKFAKVIGCYAYPVDEITGKLLGASILFNSSGGTDTPPQANSILVANNELYSNVYVGTLDKVSSVRNVQIIGNYINGVSRVGGVIGDGDCQQVLVSGNIFEAIEGDCAIRFCGNPKYPPAIPAFVSVCNNQIFSPNVSSMSLAAIRLQGDHCVVVGNTVTGGNYPYALHCDSKLGAISTGNLFERGKHGTVTCVGPVRAGD